jgi:hypothetical protein
MRNDEDSWTQVMQAEDPGRSCFGAGSPPIWRGCDDLKDVSPELYPSVGVVDEPWLSKQEMAQPLGFSRRWVELRVQEGMPCESFGTRLRFSVLLWRRG